MKADDDNDIESFKSTNGEKKWSTYWNNENFLANFSIKEQKIN